MSYVLEAAAEHSIPLIVLDRPNPIGGQLVEGPVLTPGCASFIGRYLLPVRHGLTVGELALMFNTERQLGADLTVIEAEGWRRAMWFDDTGLHWVPPSPAMPKFETAIVYPGTCLLAGTSLSDGRGTATPFECVGAPWVDAYHFADALNDLALPGVRFQPSFFLPCASKYPGEPCEGVYLHVTDRATFRPVRTGLHVIRAARHLWPGEFVWRPARGKGRPPHFDLSIGNGWVREWVDADRPVDEIVAHWQGELERFKEVRQAYLLYQ
jgi:uncharacterized protein YbbC (DUF1343 family)